MKNNNEIKKDLLTTIITVLDNYNFNTDDVNKLDICFISSIISQQIINCDNLFEDIKNNNYKYFISYEPDYSNYTNGSIIISLQSSIYYNITLCEDYNDENDILSATMSIIKHTDKDEGFYKWDEDILNYKEYEQQFNNQYKNIAKKQKQQEIKEKKNKIIELQNEINQLEKEIK